MTRTYKTTRVTTVETANGNASPRPTAKLDADSLVIIDQRNGYVTLAANVPADLAKAFQTFHRDYMRAAECLRHVKSFR